jgi:hypothetical protein
MLCMQQCIDMCDLSSEQVRAAHEQLGLQDILAIQEACSNAVRDPLTMSECLFAWLAKRTVKRCQSCEQF